MDKRNATTSEFQAIRQKLAIPKPKGLQWYFQVLAIFLRILSENSKQKKALDRHVLPSLFLCTVLRTNYFVLPSTSFASLALK